MLEEWRDIKWYEWIYQISSFWRVKALKRKFAERLLHPHKNNSWYFIVCFCVGYEKKYKLVHRLVAETFLPNKDNKETINHKNWDKTDNRVENLERMTMSENGYHRYRVLWKGNGLLWKRWCLCKTSIPILQLLDWKIINKFYWAAEAQRETWVTKSNIISCARGKLKSAWGYQWKYFNS